MRGALPVLVLALTATCALAETKAWQDTITLPTWVEGAPDIHPRFDALDPDHSFYPYTGRTNVGVKREPEAWRRLNLENEYLVCSFLPDIGGHLYSCTDKRSGRAMFHTNPSVKKDLIGPRGAWVAMGIEFNFPVAHSRDSVSPVEFGVRQNNGAAEIWLGDTDRVTGMRWIAEFILRDGSTALEQRMTLENFSEARHPYSYWANAGISLDAGTRFDYPAHVMASHGLTELYSWPRDKKGRDQSRPAAYPDELTFFAYGSRDPFMAVYDAASRTATVHVADSTVVEGKKIYHWGTTNLPLIRQRLSDDNSAYVEMQAGKFQNQAIYEFLEPGERVQFTEQWLAAEGLNGVTRANEHAILSLGRGAAAAKSEAKNDLVAQLEVTHAIKGARLALYQGSTAAWQETADLSPAKTYEHSLPNPQTGAYRFELRDATGKLLLEHTENVYEAIAQSSVKLGPQPARGPGDRRDSPADFLAAAENREKSSLNFFAEREYRLGLAKFASDPQLEKALGRLLVGEHRYSEGYPLLAEAAKKLALDSELRYYLGLAAAATGKDAEARQDWQVAGPDAHFGPSSLSQMAALDARAGHTAPALDMARQALSRQATLMPAVHLATALLRHSGQNEGARKQAEAGLALDPLDSFLRLEATRLGSADDALWVSLAADPERVLELADEYLQFGMAADALELLSRQYEAQPANQMEPGAVLPQANALVTYYRGYAETLAGRDPAADLKLAPSQPLLYVNPHLASSHAALSNALEKDPRDASALYLTGLLYLFENRVPQAADEFQAAAAIRKDLPAVHYLLGRTLLMLNDRKAEAVKTLQEGMAANPDDKELKKSLDDATRTPVKVTPEVAPDAPAPMVVPVKPATTPDEIAEAALAQAANGSATMSFFQPRSFKDPKQSEAVMRAYVEVQLQALRQAAARKDCASALTAVDQAGAPDPDLPFTARGLEAYIKGARYQYYLGAVVSLCGQGKEARRRWAKVAKMMPAVGTPDFAFPAVAAQSLGSGAKLDWNALLDQVNKAEATDAESKGYLDYSRGILLLAKGDESGAMSAFKAGMAASEGDFAQYLNQLAVAEASRAGRPAR